MSLDSWREGPPRATILDFVDRVTEDGPGFVPVSERIAVFDADGTLWCERPAYAQAAFLLAALHERVGARPELAEQPVVSALLAGDMGKASRHGLGPVAEALLDLHAGRTVDEFAALVADWFEVARHPHFGVGWDALAYVPMLELIDLLRANAFQVFIVTGGGAEFVRAVSERVFGIPPSDVVGSAAKVRYESRSGRSELVCEAKLRGSPNEGPPKAVNIQAHIGRRPILAAGNSPGDREMLEYTHTSDRPALCLVVDHDDEDREYAYQGSAATDPGAASILGTAKERGWPVVSMRRDWRRVFSGDGPGDGFRRSRPG
jgi:phosphoglycolate phosphatase-like HAD superfamily hydrolase